jgi:hypothetical protein
VEGRLEGSRAAGQIIPDWIAVNTLETPVLRTQQLWSGIIFAYTYKGYRIIVLLIFTFRNDAKVSHNYWCAMMW